MPLYKQQPSIFLHETVAPLKISDSAWHKITITYTASGEESYIALGYYARNDYVGELVHPLENRYFVYVDDISLVPLEVNEKLCAGWEQVRQEIYDENERHSLLEKKIKYYTLNPPPVVAIVKTSVSIIDTLVMPDILFASGNAILQSQSFPILDSFCRKMMLVSVDSIVIEGHTDSVGEFEFNRQLSLDRATIVKNYLQSKTGFTAITARGWAFLKPVADNKTPMGRQRNRRVEVFLYIRD
jgi:outer membrane protein OmpA-like peptidoglycan-associated protein